MFNLLKTGIGTFVSFVKILGAEERSMKEIGTTSPFIETLHIFESLCKEVLKLKHPLGPVCRENRLFLKVYSREKAPSS